MKAAFYETFGGSIRIESLSDPVPSDGGVVIEVKASGLCLSDWHGWMGHDADIQLPHVPGHEFAGTIAAVGKQVEKFNIGDRVTVPFVGGCGRCEYCLSGNHQVCDRQFQPGFTAWGSFAEYVAIEYANVNLVRLPDGMSFENAASLGCRFITAYRAVKDQGRLLEGEFLAVHGCGGVGLSAIQIGKALGAQVIAIDIADEKCDFARQLGADYTINSRKSDAVESIIDLSRGGVHVSLDAVGHKDTFLNSVKSLRKRGRHVQVGLMTGQDEKVTISMPRIVAHELEILGSHGIQAFKYPEIFDLINRKNIDLNQMITDIISLREVPERLPLLNQKTSPGITIISSFRVT